MLSEKSGRACLTESQLALRWQISIAKLQNDRWRGKGIPYMKVGRLVRYSIDDIENFELKNRQLLAIEGVQ